MNIAYDAHPMLDSQKTGIGYYEARMFNTLLTLFPSHQYTLYYFSFKNSKNKKVNLEQYRKKGAQVRECPWFHWSLYRMLWGFIPVPHQWFFGKKADITHFFSYHIPPGVHGKKIVTVHDMAYKRFPETLRFKTKMMMRLNLKRSCKRADKIITISEFSRREIIELLKIDPEKITVVPCSVDTATFFPITDQSLIDSVKSKHHIVGQYLLYMGTLEPRKNIERLIEAYALVKKNTPKVPTLVVAGRKGWMYDNIFKRVRLLALESDVLFTGYVSDADIPVLLSGSLAFLFPSLYEGFGMPPLEAMACGAPVLTSRESSLPEVVGDAAILVNPYSVSEIAQGITMLIKDEKLRSVLSLAGLKQAQKYNWERSAKLIMEVYEGTC